MCGCGGKKGKGETEGKKGKRDKFREEGYTKMNYFQEIKREEEKKTLKSIVAFCSSALIISLMSLFWLPGV